MTELEEFQSRNEAILRSIIDGTEYVAPPQSRIEELLLQLKEVIVAGGGSVSPEDIQAAIEEYLNSHEADIVTEQELSDALAGKVDKETNKSLMSDDEHTKLAGIESGAQVNTVTGVKGNAENDYRTGEINISPANIGLGNVDNTSDANKPISTATQAALNAKQDALTAGDNVSIATVNGVLTISATNTDTTYSAGTGLSLSGTTFSNAAPNVKSDWNAAAGTDAEILNKPTIPNYSNATPSTNGVGGSAGLMSAADKEKLDNNNAGYKFKIWEGSQNLVANSDLSTGYALTNFSALEIRYAMFYNHSANYIKTIRITRKDTELSFGDVIPAEKYEYSSGTLSLSICGLTISGSHIYLAYPEGASSFWVFGVYGYK